ncbi:biotin transporter BioY [Caenibacillus caldisaponilyticus]|uniref:biotin transporter BioY n=1 Tax=Caenibacillus caldisaponilyticus TaxID=1674942 RepID=UPI0009886168|nr:biotin transporter BioY [Caenibacillus caldisaponilyticus]
MKIKTVDLVLAAVYAALMAIGANIAAFLPPVQGVPLTFQTLVAILAGATLGSRIGALSMIVYTLIGLAGVPVFAGFSGGPGTIMSQTFGFILSFILTAYAVGKIVERREHPNLSAFLLAGVVGLAANYITGTLYMYFSLKLWINAPMTYGAIWVAMIPFLVKDIILTFATVLIAPQIKGRLDAVRRKQPMPVGGNPSSRSNP